MQVHSLIVDSKPRPSGAGMWDAKELELHVSISRMLYISLDDIETLLHLLKKKLKNFKLFFLEE